jgi:hypothetical protein
MGWAAMFILIMCSSWESQKSQNGWRDQNWKWTANEQWMEKSHIEYVERHKVEKRWTE